VHIKLFKKKPIEEVKQPQEYFCANINCLNEIAKFSPLYNLLTEEAKSNSAENYCFSCIVEGESS
jgi:hypothetical protein